MVKVVNLEMHMKKVNSYGKIGAALHVVYVQFVVNFYIHIHERADYLKIEMIILNYFSCELF